jgi:hypothetical protein
VKGKTYNTNIISVEQDRIYFGDSLPLWRELAEKSKNIHTAVTSIIIIQSTALRSKSVVVVVMVMMMIVVAATTAAAAEQIQMQINLLNYSVTSSSTMLT